MGDSSLPRRPPKHFMALKEKLQKVLKAFKKTFKPGSPIPTAPIYNARVGDEQGPLPPPHTPIQAKVGEIEIPKKIDREDAAAGAMSPSAATSGTNVAGTTQHVAQTEDGPSHIHPPESPRESKYAPIWSHALNEWRREHSDTYQASIEEADRALEDPDKAIDELYKIMRDEQTTDQYRARVRHYQASLSSLRGIAIAVSNMDPYKLAPIICASVFFTIDFGMNNMNEDHKDRLLKMLLSCDDMIAEYVSFERFFTRKDHPAVQKDISETIDELRGQYTDILLLTSEIYERCGKGRDQSGSSSFAKQVKEGYRDRVDGVWTILTQQIQRLEAEEKRIKDLHTRWMRKRKRLDILLSQVKETKDVRDWIKKDDDPEPELDTIAARVTTKGKYNDTAQWFRESNDYCSWSDSFLDCEKREKRAKPVLWLNGTSGTGKTTTMFHTYESLDRPVRTNLAGGVTQVIPYFCFASGNSRPGHETILRALLWHMSLLPNKTLDSEAIREYDLAHGRKSAERDVTSWERLFLNLIDSRKYDHFVFVVDALDECISKADGDEFLRFIGKEVISCCPNVHLLVSSQKHIPVEEVFGTDVLYKVDVNPADTEDDMKKFIDGELQRRKAFSQKSVFYKDDCPPNERTLLKRFRSSLLEHCQGMFRWVQIWLDICLPTTTSYIIENRSIAESYLVQLRKDGTSNVDPYNLLEMAYQRLWEFNHPRDPQEQKARDILFHVLLGSFERLPLRDIQDALGVAEETFEQGIEKRRLIELCSGFLDYRMQRLHWVHASAQAFISKMPVRQSMKSDDTEGVGDRKFSERRNHTILADIFINVIGNSSHRLWVRLWMDKTVERGQQCTPDQWIYYANDRRVKLSMNCFQRNWRAVYGRRYLDPARFAEYGILSYLLSCGWKHCALAAGKASIFDPFWVKVLRQVVISSKSAFGFTLLLGFFNNYHGNWLPLREPETGRISLNFSHVVAWLNIIHQEDISQFFSPAADPEIRQRFEDSAQLQWAPVTEDPIHARDYPLALQWAVVRRNRAAVDLILQTRNPEKDNLGQNNEETDSTGLWLAVGGKNYAIVKLLLEQSEAAVNSTWEDVKPNGGLMRSPLERMLITIQQSPIQVSVKSPMEHAKYDSLWVLWKEEVLHPKKIWPRTSDTILTWAERNQDDHLVQVLKDHNHARTLKVNFVSSRN